MMDKDYYKILEIENDASEGQIKDAYRRLAFKYHPDRNKEDPGTAEKMKRINEAYAVLSNQAKRREYDDYQHSYGSFASQKFRESHSQEDIFHGSDINQILEEMSRAFGLRNFEEVFRDFYGPNYRTFVFRKSIPLDRSFTFPSGGLLNIFFRRGLEKTFGIKRAERGRDLYDVLFLNPQQAKCGGKIEYSGQKWKNYGRVAIRIPPNLKNGQKIRLRGMGSKGKGGGETGDLYLEVIIRIPLLQRIKKWLGKLPRLK